MTAEKQEISKQLKGALDEAERLATVLRLAIKQHFGIRAEKLAEFDLQPFRGRKKSTFLPTPPPEKPEPTCSSTGALPPPSGTATRSRY